MTSFIYPKIPFVLGTFSVFIAPSHLLSEALTRYLTRQKGSILSISGNVPVILPRVRTINTLWRSENVTHAGQILTAVDDAPEHLILIEHDRSLYDEDADLIRPIALICRRKVAEKGTVFMFSARPDGWLKKFEPYAHKTGYFEDNKQDYSEKETGISRLVRQRTLEGLV